MSRLKTFVEDNLIWNKKAFPHKISANEDIVLVIREDIIIITFVALRYIILFILLLAGKLVLSNANNFLFSALYDSLFYSINTIMILLFAYNFHNYYLSLQIVTNKRLIDIDQKGLFNREVNELAIEKIEDVTYRQVGILPLLFGYGTVSVQTAAEVESTVDGGSKGITGGFVFENVPVPNEVHAMISNLFHRCRENEQIDSAKLNAMYMNRVMNSNSNNNFRQNMQRNQGPIPMQNQVPTNSQQLPPKQG